MIKFWSCLNNKFVPSHPLIMFYHLLLYLFSSWCSGYSPLTKLVSCFTVEFNKISNIRQILQENKPWTLQGNKFNTFKMSIYKIDLLMSCWGSVKSNIFPLINDGATYHIRILSVRSPEFPKILKDTKKYVSASSNMTDTQR